MVKVIGYSSKNPKSLSKIPLIWHHNILEGFLQRKTDRILMETARGIERLDVMQRKKILSRNLKDCNIVIKLSKPYFNTKLCPMNITICVDSTIFMLEKSNFFSFPGNAFRLSSDVLSMILSYLRANSNPHSLVNIKYFEENAFKGFSMSPNSINSSLIKKIRSGFYMIGFNNR